MWVKGSHCPPCVSHAARLTCFQDRKDWLLIGKTGKNLTLPWHEDRDNMCYLSSSLWTSELFSVTTSGLTRRLWPECRQVSLTVKQVRPTTLRPLLLQSMWSSLCLFSAASKDFFRSRARLNSWGSAWDLVKTCRVGVGAQIGRNTTEPVSVQQVENYFILIAFSLKYFGV